MNLHIVPLAIAMMAGPQIVSAIVILTGEKPVKPSAAYVGAIAFAATLGIGLSMLFFTFVDKGASLHKSGTPSQTAKTIELILVGILIALAIRTFFNRANIKQPKWMSAIQTAPPSRTFKIGFGLIYLMPTDLVIMITCGLDLVSNKHSIVDAAPFLGLTTLIAAFPLLAYLLFRKRAETAMPKVRTWIEQNAWAVNIFVYALFIYLILD